MSDETARTATPTQRARRWLGVGLVVVVPLVLLAALALAGAEVYTARPKFCGSCHVMQPYFESWSRDLHGRKLGVRCVDCHYRPGERHTVLAKLRGLSQVASYFSGRYGAARPRAHVADASCLRSSCHGDRAYMDKPLLIGKRGTETRIVDGKPITIQRNPTVVFTHAHHAKVAASLDELVARGEQLEQQVLDGIPDETARRLRQVLVSTQPLAQRLQSVSQLLERIGRGDRLAAALELVQLRDRQTRLRQLAGLKCTACHVFDPTTRQHLTVNTTTCFTCHFTNQPFNTATAECRKCHEPPQRRVLVHRAGAAATQAVFMDHAELVQRDVKCRSCHVDVVRGQARVTRRACTSCHDRQEYLEGFDQATLKDVERYHAIHVARQRARCEDCHSTIEHSLLDPVHVAASSQYIELVRRDCEHCHPKHHSEQITLLMGMPRDGVQRSMPNPMFGSRINCQACHVEPGEDFVGDRLFKATADACAACHGEEGREKFQRWRAELDTRLEEVVALRERVAKRLSSLTQAGRAPPAEFHLRLDEVDRSLHLLRAGNGIHNHGYAVRLLDSAREALTRLLEQLPQLPGPPPARTQASRR